MELMDMGTKLAFLWRLVRASENGSVKWVANTDYNFRTQIGPFGYTIASTDRDDLAPFVFAIYRLEEASPDATKVDEWGTDRHSVLNDALMALYGEVKRHVKGIHSTVGEMFESLAEIDGGSPVPGPLEDEPF